MGSIVSGISISASRPVNRAETERSKSRPLIRLQLEAEYRASRQHSGGWDGEGGMIRPRDFCRISLRCGTRDAAEGEASRLETTDVGPATIFNEGTDVIFGLTKLLLESPQVLILLAIHVCRIIIGEIPIGLLDSALHLVPLAFQPEEIYSN